MVLCSELGHSTERLGTIFFFELIIFLLVSVSVLQWLCNADHRSHVPQKRLKVDLLFILVHVVKHSAFFNPSTTA